MAVSTKKKTKIILIFLAAIIISLLAFVIAVRFDLFSYIRFYDEVETDCGDIIRVCVKHRGFPDQYSVLYLKAPKMKSIENMPVYVNKTIKSEDVVFNLLFEENDIRVYSIKALGHESEFGSEYDYYIILDSADKKYISTNYVAAAWDRINDTENARPYMLLLAKHFLLEGSYEWLINYGEDFMEQGDEEIINIISGIANGKISLPELSKDWGYMTEAYSKDAVYKKCIDLTRSNGDVEDS